MTVFPLKKNSILPVCVSVDSWERKRDCGGFLHSFYSGHFLTSNSLLCWHRERLSVTGQRRPEGAQVSILCMDCTLGGSAHRAVGGGVGWDRGLQPLTENPATQREDDRREAEYWQLIYFQVGLKLLLETSPNCLGENEKRMYGRLVENRCLWRISVVFLKIKL